MTETTTTTTPDGRSFGRPVLTERSESADAWLFILKRPGKIATFATIDPTGSESWPWDEWTAVRRVALVESGPAETLIDRRQNVRAKGPRSPVGDLTRG